MTLTNTAISNTCTCACHEAEENHNPDDCYCMQKRKFYCPKCQEFLGEFYEDELDFEVCPHCNKLMWRLP